MRVLIDGRGLLEDLQAGVEGYTWKMIDYLQKLYPEDEYIVFSYSWKKEPSQAARQKIEWIHYRWPNILMSVSWPWFGWPKVDQVVSPVDLVWVPNVRFMPTTDQVKKIATVHDLSFEVMPDCFSVKRRLWHWHMRIRQNLSRMDKVVTVSANTRQDLIDYYDLTPEKISLIYSGIDKPDDLTAVESTKKGRDYIIAIGTIEPRKNLAGLLKAYRYYLDFLNGQEDLVLVGGQGWDWELDQMIDQLELSDRVKVTGFVTDEEKNNWLKAAKLLVFVSYYEGFGFPPLEAMSFGVPVVASHAGSLGEILADGSWLVDPMDTTGMAGAMKNLMQNQKLRQRMIESGRQVAAKYDWAKTASQFRQEAVSLVGGR